MTTKLKIKARRGGPRPNSGRPPKPDKQEWGQITCVLRHQTIEKLRRSATPPGKEELSKYFGEYLQWHLEHYPPLNWQTWQAFLHAPTYPKPAPVKFKRFTKKEGKAFRQELAAALLEK